VKDWLCGVVGSEHGGLSLIAVDKGLLAEVEIDFGCFDFSSVKRVFMSSGMSILTI